MCSEDVNESCTENVRAGGKSSEALWGIGVRYFDDRASRSPLVMKTRGTVWQGLDFGKDRDSGHDTPLRLSMSDRMVDSRSITEGKDVAGMAE